MANSNAQLYSLNHENYENYLCQFGSCKSFMKFLKAFEVPTLCFQETLYGLIKCVKGLNDYPHITMMTRNGKRLMPYFKQYQIIHVELEPLFFLPDIDFHVYFRPIPHQTFKSKIRNYYIINLQEKKI